MQLTAVLGGKAVTYEATATFRVDRRKPGHKWEHYDSALPNIHQALSIYHSVSDRGFFVKLVAVHGRGRKVLCRTGK